jgi:hypothetical protein
MTSQDAADVAAAGKALRRNQRPGSGRMTGEITEEFSSIQTIDNYRLENVSNTCCSV